MSFSFQTLKAIRINLPNILSPLQSILFEFPIHGHEQCWASVLFSNYHLSIDSKRQEISVLERSNRDKNISSPSVPKLHANNVETYHSDVSLISDWANKTGKGSNKVLEKLLILKYFFYNLRLYWKCPFWRSICFNRVSSLIMYLYKG